MDKTLNELIDDNNGYLIASIAIKNGYSRQSVLYHAKKNNMQRISKGIYAKKDVWVDDLFCTYLNNQEIIYSFQTSLYLNGLMEREPAFTDVTVKYGYNATHLKKRGLIIHTSIDRLFQLGVKPIKTSFGNIVNSYDMERTICDIVKNKEKIDIQVFNYALNEYVKRKDKRIPTLLEYASKLKVLDQIKMYLEVLL